MKRRCLLSAALAVLLCGQASAEEGGGPCEPISCSGHGRCVVLRGEPGCACEEGYLPDPLGINCVPLDGVAQEAPPPSAPEATGEEVAPQPSPWIEPATSEADPVEVTPAPNAVLEPPATGAEQIQGPARGTRGWLELSFEVNVAQRNFSVAIDPNCDTSNRSEVSLPTGAYPEGGYRLWFLPGAIFSDRWYSGFGLDLSFHHHYALSIVNRRRDEEVEARQWAVAGGLIYRYVFGTADRGASLTARLGLGRYDFFLGDVGNDVVPPMAYDYVYLGLQLFVPLATRYIGVDLAGDFNGVYSIGDEATAAYNASETGPSARGFRAMAGLSGQIVAGLRWRLAVELLGFYSDHEGKGRGFGQSPSTECTGECVSFPGCVDMTSPTRDPVIGGIFTTDTARDLVIRTMFQLAYQFGSNR